MPRASQEAPSGPRAPIARPSRTSWVRTGRRAIPQPRRRETASTATDEITHAPAGSCVPPRAPSHSSVAVSRETG